jgi:hypothetical protein
VRRTAAELPAEPRGLLRASVFQKPGCPPLTHVFVCLPDDTDGLRVGLALHHGCALDAPIVVRVYDADHAALLPRVTDPDPGGICVFDQIDGTCRPDELFVGVHEMLARAFHRAYLHQQSVLGKTPRNNPSLRDWADLPQAIKESNRALADDVPVKLHAVDCELSLLIDPAAEMFTFTVDEVEKLARSEHERWMAQARPDHPGNIPWERLDEPTKNIDRNFVRRMPALLAGVGLQIERAREPVPSRSAA